MSRGPDSARHGEDTSVTPEALSVNASKRCEAILAPMSSPAEAIAAMRDRLAPVGVERLTVERVAGRVLAEAVHADRDSPAADVSAMDGYAVRIGELQAAADHAAELPVAFEVQTGRTPEPLPIGHAARVFTGGVVPAGTEAVLRREDTRELASSIAWHGATPPRHGAHIRRRGENAAVGDVLVKAGRRVGPAEVSAILSTGVEACTVHRLLRVAIIVTGNEIDRARDSTTTSIDTARLRDSNGPTLAALLSTPGWCDVEPVKHVDDDIDATVNAIEHAAERADAVITTGGVSMGDHDCVPEALFRLGATIVYHHLSMRPGKPNLGAVLPGSVPVIALPGNPVSVAVGSVVLAGPVLRHLAGVVMRPDRPRVHTTADESAGGLKVLQLWHYPLMTLGDSGAATPVQSRGSGDIAALARSDGFVELPPRESIDGNHCSWLTWAIA